MIKFNKDESMHQNYRHPLNRRRLRQHYQYDAFDENEYGFYQVCYQIANDLDRQARLTRERSDRPFGVTCVFYSYLDYQSLIQKAQELWRKIDESDQYQQYQCESRHQYQVNVEIYKTENSETRFVIKLQAIF